MTGLLVSYCSEIAPSLRCTGSVNVEPRPTWLFTQIRPPWSSTNFLQSANPTFAGLS